MNNQEEFLVSIIPLPNIFKLDHSRRISFEECRLKYYFQYILHLQSLNGSCAIRFGVTFHAMVEGFYSYITKHGWTSETQAMTLGIELGKAIWDLETEEKLYKEYDYRTFELCCKVFIEYVKLYSHDKVDMEVLSTEKAFEVQIELKEKEGLLFPNLEKVKLIFAGKVDLTIKQGGMLSILDHKTTSMYLASASKDIARSPQGFGYIYGEYLETGQKPYQIIYNYIHASSRWSKKTNSFGNVKTEFGRFNSIPTDRDLEIWRLSFLQTSQDILGCYKTGYWNSNLESCYSKYGPCPCLSLCEQGRNPKEVNTMDFVVREWNPKDNVDKVEELKKQFGI